MSVEKLAAGVRDLMIKRDVSAPAVVAVSMCARVGLSGASGPWVYTGPIRAEVERLTLAQGLCPSWECFPDGAWCFYARKWTSGCQMSAGSVVWGVDGPDAGDALTVALMALKAVLT